ncbi:winged helix-turn-helix domain-containing protein [Oricola thermophila]|uniref:Winged helix-turn-helix domain-containing protein n=1 Tax=Oricola thermophila TaxID=2742145 RepID=A0A6N1VDP6_9HYPH|nr:helix-turn-helix domain-containing protein [Oricola thermophila]QKV18838.1 winged helix-turn-helix domain-containing protein [Oricola thermophila]
MRGTIVYVDKEFDPNFLYCMDKEGNSVRFSRAERILLKTFSKHPGIVLSRDTLLDALAGPGSDASDRNVDFLINRLRRKLGDSARNARFIATQYGEGYVWIAERAAPSLMAQHAFLVVGPLRGLRFIGPHAGLARTFARILATQIGAKLAKEHEIVVDENCPGPDRFPSDPPQFAVDLNFLLVGDRLDCALVLKRFATGQIIRASRHTLAEALSAQGENLPETVEAIATDIWSAVWKALAQEEALAQPPPDKPLAVRMHDAAAMLTQNPSWMEAEARLRSTLESNPSSHDAAVMLATCLHSKYIMTGTVKPRGTDRRREDEDEMERLLLTSLPHLNDNPVLMMAAGKLLYFLDRGHRSLGAEIIENAFHSSTAFATAFTTYGQLQMLLGDIDEALALYERGFEICEPGSDFYFYLFVLKCQALIAKDDREQVDILLNDLFDRFPAARAGLSVMFAPDTSVDLHPETRALFEAMSLERARDLLIWMNYVSARLFRFQEHGANILKGPTSHLLLRFGRDVLADEIAHYFPETGATVRASRTASRRRAHTSRQKTRDRRSSAS